LAGLHSFLSSTTPVAHSALILLAPYDTSSTDLAPLSLHDALPILPLRVFGRLSLNSISLGAACAASPFFTNTRISSFRSSERRKDRKSTRLNSSHVSISYAVFCLKKKKRRQTLCRRGRCDCRTHRS